ncbi:MAG: acyl-CoA thioesterase [Planctomycetota bacterium]|nr:acyl-CoA thioesterase [Planctomycetota bacterium]
MPSSFVQRRVVEFAETDMAGIVHFANFFRWMESAEHAFFRSLGLSVHGDTDGAMYGWARVHAECDYRAPLRYQDEVEVELFVREKRPSAITYLHVFRRVDGDSREEVARGSITAVCVSRPPGEERMRAVPMPEPIARQIEVAPPEALEP